MTKPHIPIKNQKGERNKSTVNEDENLGKFWGWLRTEKELIALLKKAELKVISWGKANQEVYADFYVIGLLK